MLQEILLAREQMLSHTRARTHTHTSKTFPFPHLLHSLGFNEIDFLPSNDFGFSKARVFLRWVDL